MKKLLSILLIAILAFGEVSGLMLASPPQPAMAMGVETDVFDSSWGSIEFRMQDSSIEAVELSGTSTMQVFFEGTEEGTAFDDDGDGRDEVEAQLVDFNLVGLSPAFGPVNVRLNPAMPSLGEMEEQADVTTGVLDLPPFAPIGTMADSFFNVYFEVEIGGQVLYNIEPAHMSAEIQEKPPGPGDIYMGVSPVELIDENGSPTGIFMETTMYRPSEAREIEVDVFSETVAQLLIQLPPSPGIVTPRPGLPPTDGEYSTSGDVFAEYVGAGLQIVLQDALLRPLAEPAPVIVNVGSDEQQSFQSLMLTNVVVTSGPLGPASELVQIELTGPVQTIAQGKADETVGVFDAEIVEMTLHGDIPGVGPINIRESPYLPSIGQTAITDIGGGLYHIESFFDVFTELSVDGGASWIAATDGVRMNLLELQLVPLVGPAEVHVFFEGSTGTAQDDDGNGLDEVATEIKSMDLKGMTPTGPIHVGVRTDLPTEGEIEELVNNTPGRLEVNPFAAGDASSFFDVWPEITMGGQVFSTAAPLRWETTVFQEPPQDGERYVNPFLTRLELIDSSTGQGTGTFLWSGIHQPDSTTEVDLFSQTNGLVELVGGPLGTVPTAFPLQGDAEVHVYFEGPGYGDAVDDDWNGRDEVVQQLVSMNLAGGGVTLRVRDIARSPFGPSLGQIEELANNTPGRLDLDPFHPGDADSFFDVLFEVELSDGTILHNEQPVRIQAVISEKPWNTSFEFIIPPTGPAELSDESNQLTGIFFVQGRVFTTMLPVLSIDDVTVNEGAGEATFTVSLSSPSSLTVTVDYSTADGTALAGSDYTAISGTLIFSPGDTSETIPVPIVEDDVYEGSETFYLNLDAPANATISDSQGIGTILDNEPQPTLSINDVTVNEGAGEAYITVSLSSPSKFFVTVNYFTVDGTAQADSDYTAISGILTFSPLETTKTISVPIVDDLVYEGPETFLLNLDTLTNAVISDGQGIGTIIDNDLPPELMVEALIDVVDATDDLPKGTETSLVASLNTAMKVLNDSNPKNDTAAIKALEAFVNKIEAQRGKKIPEEVADRLIAEAQAIITVLSAET